jgi:hypothetical protein
VRLKDQGSHPVIHNCSSRGITGKARNPCLDVAQSASEHQSMLVFWVVTPCGLGGGYQRFGGTYCLHLQGRRQYFLRNVGTHLQVHTALRLRRPTWAMYERVIASCIVHVAFFFVFVLSALPCLHDQPHTRHNLAARRLFHVFCIRIVCSETYII